MVTPYACRGAKLPKISRKNVEPNSIGVADMNNETPDAGYALI